MKSEDRRAIRRARREEKRRRKREERARECTLEKVADLNSLYKAQREAARGVAWKASTQRYQWHWLLKIASARKALLAGEEICRGFHEFDITERGQHRHISSVHFSERVVQKSLTQNVLVPAIVPSLILDNTANIKGWGTAFAIERTKMYLARHYAAHGPEGYVLQGDFSNYFGSIPHAGVFDLLERHVTDPGAKALARHMVEVQGDVGLGLGSEPNQIYAVSYPNPLDHFIAECCGVGAYVRYMDDFIIIHPDKADLWAIAAALYDMTRQMGLVLHPKKTHVTKLTRGFVFLKKKFTYDRQTGGVVVRPCRESVTRERRRIKRQAGLVASGKMTAEQLNQAYQSWRGSLTDLNAHRTKLGMDALFASLTHGATGRAAAWPPPDGEMQTGPGGATQAKGASEWTN